MSYPRWLPAILQEALPEHGVKSAAERDKRSCLQLLATLAAVKEPLSCWSYDLPSEVQLEIIVHLCFCVEKSDLWKIRFVLEPDLRRLCPSLLDVYANEGDRHLAMPAYKCAFRKF